MYYLNGPLRERCNTDSDKLEIYDDDFDFDDSFKKTFFFLFYFQQLFSLLGVSRI